MLTVEYAMLVNVSGELETPQLCTRMGWSGRFTEGYFIREYDHDGITRQWIGNTDEGGEPEPFDSEQAAAEFMLTEYRYA